MLRQVVHKEFALRTDQLRGGNQRPAQEQIDMVEADILTPAPTLALALTLAFEPHPRPYPYPSLPPHP